jgi:hypothetical protein
MTKLPFHLSENQLFKVTLPLTLFLSGLFVFCGLINFYADSEIWSASVSQFLLSGQSSFDFLYIRPLFHAILYPIHWLSMHPEWLILARVEFLLVGVIHLFLFGLLGFELLRSRSQSILLVGFLITNSFFLSRGYRIRADLLASCFFTAWCLFFVKWCRSNQPDQYKRWMIALLVCAFLSTPKSIYFIAIAVLLTGLNIGKPVSLVFGSKKRIGSALIIITVFVYFIITAPSEVLVKNLITGSALYFVNQFEGGLDVPRYLSATSFVYFSRWIVENPIMVFGLFSSLILLVVEKLRSFAIFNSRPERHLTLGGFVALFFVIFHNDKLPHFICAMTPIITIASFLGWKYLLQLVTSKWSRWKFFPSYPVCMILLLVIATVASVDQSLRLYRENNNFQQINALNILKDYKDTLPEATVFDSLGLLPYEKTIYRFLEGGKTPENKQLLKEILALRPQILFYTNKFLLAEPSLSHLLIEPNYAHVGSGVFVEALNTRFPNTSDSSPTSSVPIRPVIEDLVALYPEDRLFYVYSQQRDVKFLSKTGEEVQLQNPVELSELIRKVDIIQGQKNRIVSLSPYRFTNLPEDHLISRLFRFDQDY